MIGISLSKRGASRFFTGVGSCLRGINLTQVTISGRGHWQARGLDISKVSPVTTSTRNVVKTKVFRAPESQTERPWFVEKIGQGRWLGIDRPGEMLQVTSRVVPVPTRYEIHSRGREVVLVCVNDGVTLLRIPRTNEAIDCS